MENYNKTALDWLKLALEKRKEKNTSYSSRAFARDINISQTLISLILNGQRPLTKKVALKILPGLGFNPEETSQFMLVVQSEEVQRKLGRKAYTRDIPVYREVPAIHHLQA